MQQHNIRIQYSYNIFSGVKSFNLDHKRGLKELDRFGFLDSTNPDEIAYFLFHEGR